MSLSALYIVLTGLFYGTIIFGGGLFIRYGFSSYEAALYTMLFGFLLLPFLYLRKQWRLRVDMVPFFLGYGIFGALTRLCQFIALAMGVPVSMTVLLLYTMPVWVTLFGWLLLRERITLHKIAAIILVLCGVFVLVSPKESMVSNPLGLLFALLGGIMFAGIIIFFRKGGQKKFHPLTVATGYMVFTSLALIVLYPAVWFFSQGTISIAGFRFLFEPQVYLLLFLYALVSAIIPQYFLAKGIQKVPASTAGIILLLEPLSASLLAFVFMDEPITKSIVLGGALILLANYIAIKKG